MTMTPACRCASDNCQLLLITEIRRRQQECVPLLLRIGAIQGIPRVRRQEWLDRLEIQAVCKVRETAPPPRPAVLPGELFGVARNQYVAQPRTPASFAPAGP